MKPAPAMSTLATAGLAGSDRTRASATLRGFWRAALARRMARLLARSPCCASRVFSTSMLKVRAAAGTRSSGRSASACRSKFSISVFKANPWLRSTKGSVRGTKGRQFTAKSSIYFQRIHVDGPTQPGRTGEFFHLRQPILQKALQRGPRGGLDQEMRTEVIGAPRNQGAGGPQHFDGRFVPPAAGVDRGAQKCVQSEAVFGFGPQ